MSKQRHRAHVKRAKHGCKVFRPGFVKGSQASFASIHLSEVLRKWSNRGLTTRRAQRRLRIVVARSHAIRGGYHS